MKQYLVAESGKNKKRGNKIRIFLIFRSLTIGYLAARQYEAQALFKHLETLNLTSDIVGTISSLKPQAAREDER